MNLVQEIEKLKIEKKAIILAHYYQSKEIQEIADYVGDSYYLSQIGMNSDASIIVFCGVEFMAESAKVLSPDKKVYLANKFSFCSMAKMADPEAVIKLKNQYPNSKVVCYVNSTTEVKAISDVCCTSSNAENIVKNLDSENIIFVPDKNLGSYIQEKTPDKNVVLWDGYCCIHNKIRPEDVLEAKNKYGNNIEVLMHPECEKSAREIADFIGSTGQIISYVDKSHKEEFIIVTDVGIEHELVKRNPNKKFYFLDMVCEHMKLTTIEDVYNCLIGKREEIIIGEELVIKAEKSLKEMHKLA